MLITKIEAKEACDWLRSAGFPQYVQLFKDCQFPIDIEWAKRDHNFLDQDAIDSLCRRLSTLNKCVEMKLDLWRSKRRGEDDENDDPCAISNKWSYDRQTRQWQRSDTTLDFLPVLGTPDDPQKVSLCSAHNCHDICSLHSTSSAESEEHEGALKSHMHVDIPTAGLSTPDDQASRSSSRCSSNNKISSLETSFSGGSGDGGSSRQLSTSSLEAEHCFLTKPPRKKGSSLLRKIEKLKLRGTSALLSPQQCNSGLVLVDGPMEEALSVLQCPESLQGRAGSQTSSSPSLHHTDSGSCSSCSPSESSSTVSTPSPVVRVRSNSKWTPRAAGDIGAQSAQSSLGQEQLLHRDSEDYINQINSQESLVFQIPHGHKHGTFPTTLTHKETILSPIIDNTSINWRTGSFHGYRGRRNCHGGTSSLTNKNQEEPSSSKISIHSPLTSLDPRVSIYDNVPAQQPLGTSEGSGSEAEHEEETKVCQLLNEADIFSALDSVMERINDLQQLVSSWSESLAEEDCQRELSSSSSSSSSSRDSPCQTSSPSPCSSSHNYIHLEIQRPQDGESTEESEVAGSEQQTRLLYQKLRGSHPLQWASQQSLSPMPPSAGPESNSVSDIHLLQKLSLLKLTALMDKYSPSSKQGWSWTVPKPLRKSKHSEVKGRKVFGVPLIHSAQQSGEPLPPCILRALTYLRTECLDQVGLFRKSGVKSRIQYLRDMVESDQNGVFFQGQSAFDVADMVKQYFRDLPEPVFTNKLCESFLHIYQYFPKDQQLIAVQAAIWLLPDENREALRTLLFFLNDVVACVEENQMTPANIAVCLAPSLFHLNTWKRDANTARSSHRKHSLGCPDQRDLSENLAATQGLAHMVTEAQRLFQFPEFWAGRSTNPSCVSEDSLSGDMQSQVPNIRGREVVQEISSQLEQSTQCLLREAKERSKGWEVHPAPDPVDLAYKRMDDDYPLRLWRGSIEIDSPQKELHQRLLRDQGLWEKTLHQAEVVQTLSKDTEIYRYLLQGQCHELGSWPQQEHLLLRTWQTDPALGPVYLSSVSVDYPGVPVEGVRAQVNSCLYFLEAIGTRRTRLTHLCRTDSRGRSQNWHNKVSGHLLASNLLAIRDSFLPDHRETKR